MDQLTQFIINHWQLWLALLVILVLIFINERQSQKGKLHEISPQKAVDLINHQDAQILDLRDKDAFKNGHIIAANRVNANEVSAEKLSGQADKPVILICARGLQSAALAKHLRSQGVAQIYALAGGLAAWQAADLPLIKGK